MPWASGGKGRFAQARGLLRPFFEVMHYGDPVPPNMLLEVNTEDLRRNLSHIINRAAYAADPVLVTRRGRRIAAIVSIVDLVLLESVKEARRDLPRSSNSVARALRWDLFFG